MAKLRMPVERARKMLADRTAAGEAIAAKVELAEKTRGYRDWLALFAAWRKDSIAELKTIYDGSDTATEFQFATDTTERSSPSTTFQYRKVAVRDGIQKLESLIDRLPLALPESEDAAGIKSLHSEIYSRCHTLYAGGDYAEAVEKSFKVV
jgi:hypothetical protein